ncbi:MAG: hypothetical protein DRJ66_07800 [Thermoprotei archaeon]|nr:MAG: hypothetical protein DRJ66_07800 [Thermoprotei archaeon]
MLIIVFSHYYIVHMEKPYLERIFGGEYLEYKRRTPRYIRLPFTLSTHIQKPTH